jgi:hypothetical protein
MQAFDEAREWPFEGLSEGLAHDLFDAQWEVRHGAAAALREILRVHGKGAGKGVAAILLGSGGVMYQCHAADHVPQLRTRMRKRTCG